MKKTRENKTLICLSFGPSAMSSMENRLAPFEWGQSLLSMRRLLGIVLQMLDFSFVSVLIIRSIFSER